MIRTSIASALGRSISSGRTLAAHRSDQTKRPITVCALVGVRDATDRGRKSNPKEHDMLVFRLPVSVRGHLCGAAEPLGAPIVRLHRRRHGGHQQPPVAVRPWSAAGTKTFLLRFREKEHEMPSLQQRPRSRSTVRLISSAAAALFASGASIVNWLLRQRDYRRTLNELHNLSELDRRELRISKADFAAIAWAEAERLHELRRGSQPSIGSPDPCEPSPPSN
jgi:hypothetical protein